MGLSAFGIDHGEVSKADQWTASVPEGGLQSRRHTAIAMASSKPKRVGHSSPGLFDPEAKRHRRAGAASGALAAGSGALGYGAVKTRRAASAHIGEASKHGEASAGHFADSVKPRLSAAARQTHHVKGMAAQGARYQALGNAGKAFRRSSRLGMASAAVGAAAVGVHRHGERGGRSYGYR